jgi:hypothetical protein
MSSIILTTVGQVAGSASGIPFGGQIGAQLAGSLSGALGGASKHRYEGARLENLAVQTSIYGRMIPLVFGTVRIGGNVIWSRPIKELVTTSTTTQGGGGKGGGGSAKKSKTTTTQYSYYVTLAIAVCEGEVSRVDRVWADAKLLDLSKGVYRVYNGTETQLPDALIESYQGVGKTPAYRGMAYVVIEDFPLADYGNRIPNFTFEVTRRTPQGDAAEVPVEALVKSLMLIPGSGEFVYDTQTEYKISGTDAFGNFVQNGYQIPLNQHTAQGKANALVALDQMQQTFPNLEWVGLVVNWFGTSMDIANCEVFPCVEYQNGVKTTPDDWQVAGYSRGAARVVGNDAGVLRYGGTPDDDSIVRLITELRARGLKILFYPMMLMDVAGKPWRGELTGAASSVNNFFTRSNGYNRFINHYANLVKNRVDAFAIGTEMKKLTAIRSSVGVYPAVDQLVALAASVKSTMGATTNITYAADWSEYHHDDNGWYHLDPLWASPSIDMVGIDAYFPLSDGVQTGYDIEALKAGWTSGEGYDWYYTDSTRTVKAPLSPAYAWKNISYWWSNVHTNPSGATTAWVPQSKSIWFTEYGFASVDGCANEPNVFVDGTTSASAYPRFSRGRIDFMAQRTAIAATEAQWGSSGMVPRRFLWTWDARPYPYWPDLLSVWADGKSWVTGHWVQGKLGASHVAAAVEQIATRAGLSDAQINTSQLQVMLDGFVLHQRLTARAALEQLMQAYFFTIKESGNALVAILRDATIDATVDVSACIPQKIDNQHVPYVLERKEDLVLPDRLEVQYLNRLQRYEANIQSASRSTADATDTITVRVSLVLSEQHARAISETLLADRWAERSQVTLQLPLQFAALEPGDMLQLNDGAIVHRIRIRRVQIGRPGIVKVKGVVDAAQTWDGYVAPTVGSDGALVLPSPPTRLEVIDIPAFPNDALDAMTLRFAACGVGNGWGGASISQQQNGGDDQALIDITNPAVIGSAITGLPAGATHLFDRVNTVDVSLLGDASLSSANEISVLNGANVAVLGDEVLQFANATLISPGTYRLSSLLRGRLGTEYAMASHVAGERFVLLDNAVIPLTFAASNRGQQWNMRATTFGNSLSTGTVLSTTVQGNSLKPLSPVRPSAVRDGGGNITIRWIRRTRGDGALRDAVEIPLNEANEQYNVVVYNGANVVRSWLATTTSVGYSAADQTADFGSAPASLTLAVAQVSALVGQGQVLQAVVNVE